MFVPLQELSSLSKGVKENLSLIFLGLDLGVWWLSLLRKIIVGDRSLSILFILYLNSRQVGLVDWWGRWGEQV